MKKKCLAGLLVLTIVAVCVFAFVFAVDRRPFEDLTASEVCSASVLLWPPKETVEIQDIDTLVALLGDIELERRSLSHLASGGQSCIFTIQKADGTAQEINVFGATVLIDGIGYKAAYPPCEAINQYANALLGQ